MKRVCQSFRRIMQKATGCPRRFRSWRYTRMNNGPFEQFQNALADPGMDGPKPEARWQALNASLNGIKRVIRP